MVNGFAFERVKLEITSQSTLENVIVRSMLHKASKAGNFNKIVKSPGS